MRTLPVVFGLALVATLLVGCGSSPADSSTTVVDKKSDAAKSK